MLKRFRQAWKIAKQIDEQKSITPMTVLPSWKSNQAIWKDWSTENAVREGYKASTWVYSCVNRIAKTAASVPWKVHRETAEGLEEVSGHPLELLMRRPNAYMSGQDVMERLVTHLYLGGNTILSKVRANNILAELWPVSPDLVAPVPNKYDFISGYEYKVEGRSQFVPAADVCHVMFIDPSNPYWGMAPLQAVARSVDSDVEMVEFQKVSLQNRAITDGVFSFKEPLTVEQWQAAREQVRQQHMGAGNARTPWVLGGDATWQQMSLTPAEMDFIESRKFSREEICSVFNVPPPLVGLYDNATLANIETSRKIFWLDTMIPLLEDLKSSFNLSLTPEFGPGFVLSYDVSNVQAIQENYTEKVQTAQTLFSMGVPFNLINQKLQLGFDKIEGGDLGYLPTSIMPASSIVDVNVNNEVDKNLKQNSISPAAYKAWNLETDEQKELYWKDVEGRRESWVAQYADRVLTLFAEEADEIAWVYEQHGGEDALNQIDVMTPRWEQLHVAMGIAIVEEFGASTWGLLKAQKPPLHKAFDPWDELIQGWIQTRAAETVRGILDTTKDLIRNVIAVGEDEGLGVSTIARMIRERYDGFSQRRAETIARTETVAASNYGSMQAAKQTGLNPKKVWVSAMDARVRETHRLVSGSMKDIDEPFHVGLDVMQHPCGGSRAEENVHCRCTLSYRVVR